MQKSEARFRNLINMLGVKKLLRKVGGRETEAVREGQRYKKKDRDRKREGERYRQKERERKRWFLKVRGTVIKSEIARGES